VTIKSFLSFDVEALPGRVADAENHLDRLIWGKVDGEEYGITRICKVLQQYKIKGNFFVDFSACLLYGDKEIQRVVDYLLTEGHEVHAHLHSEWVIRKWGLDGIGIKAGGFDEIGFPLTKSLLSFTAWKYRLLTGKDPSFFRPGGFLFNRQTALAAKETGFKGMSIYNDHRHGSLAVSSLPDAMMEPFVWENGLMEIPVDLSPEPLNHPIVNYFFVYDRVRERKQNKTFNLVLHSWSLLKRDEHGHHLSFAAEHEERLHLMCSHLTSVSDLFGYNDYIEQFRPSAVYSTESIKGVEDERILVRDDVASCVICGAIIATRILKNDVCLSCGSRARHRQLADAIRKAGNPFDGKTVIACHATPLEILSFLHQAKELLNFDVRPVEYVNMQMDIQDMSVIEDNRFDCFIALHVLNHVKNDAQAIAEISRVLKPNGMFVVTVPYREDETTTELENITEHYGKDALDQFGVGSYRRYGKKDFADLLSGLFDVAEFDGLDDITRAPMTIFMARKRETVAVNASEQKLEILAPKPVEAASITLTAQPIETATVAADVPALAEVSVEAHGDYKITEERLSHLRSLEQWPSKNIRWNSLQDFVDQISIESGIHSILVGNVILDIFIGIVHSSPAYVYFHGNCPRCASFYLPVFSGSNITGSLNTTKIVPSDPALLLDAELELAWHAGFKGVDLQGTYNKIIKKVLDVTAAPYSVFWGGSGGGFAALYYSYFVESSIAFVWNPQVNLLHYHDHVVKKYGQTAFGLEKTEELAPALNNNVVYDLASLYKNGHKNKIIYLQNYEDWHTQGHLVPFLKEMGLAHKIEGKEFYNGRLSPDFYLFLGNISKDHDPPAYSEIYLCLNNYYYTQGKTTEFDFNAFRKNHHRAAPTPDWIVDKVTAKRISYFKEDWPLFTEHPAIDDKNPFLIKLSTSEIVSVNADGEINWETEFKNDIATSIFELNSLMHVGRLLGAFEESKDEIMLEAALKILSSFFNYIRDKKAYHQIMTNRSYSSADHSMSIRANVLIKAVQILRQRTDHRELLKNAIAHIWDIADIISNAENVEPSNHGIMVCVTLAQIANQFSELQYLHEEMLKASTNNLLSLMNKCFDTDGFANENTVGYHRFILKLLSEYINYIDKNKLVNDQLQDISNMISRGEQALSICVWQDGSIPPLGDSPMYKLAAPSINHSKWFKQSGLLIIKNADLYLSMICGSRSDNHKQVDDSSITLRYHNENIVIDGGSFCYDANNKYRRYVESFKGHCAIYPEELADLSALKYLYNVRGKAAITEYVEKPESTYAQCNYSVNNEETKVIRQVWVLWPDEIVIVDRVVVKGREKAKAFSQSFLISPHMISTAKSDDKYTFDGDRHCLTVYHLSGSRSSLYHGQEEPNLMGWCSMDWQVVLPTYQIVFSQICVASTFVTVLKLQPKGSMEIPRDQLKLWNTGILDRV